MSEFVVRPLVTETWDGYSSMVERHNGVFGGCWCTWFHTMSADKERTYEANRSLKQRLVEQGRAHAACRVRVHPQQGKGQLRHAPHRALTQ